MPSEPCASRESKELSLSHQGLCQPEEEELGLANKVGLESGWNSACSILGGWVRPGKVLQRHARQDNLCGGREVQ